MDLKGLNQVIGDPNSRENYTRYLNEITKFQPLTKIDEIKYFKLIELGDEKAYDKIYKHNLLFVVSVAKAYSKMITKSNLTLEDLINDGNLGLSTAIKKFDYRKNNKFITHAVWWIRHEIQSSIQRNLKNIRIPSNIYSDVKKYYAAESKLEAKLGRTPMIDEVFEELKEDVKENFGDLLFVNKFESSLSCTVSEDNTTSLADMVMCDNKNPYDEYQSNEQMEWLNKIFNKTPTYTKEMIFDYFGIGGREQLSLEAIAFKYYLSVKVVEKTITTCLSKIKNIHLDKKEFFFNN